MSRGLILGFLLLLAAGVIVVLARNRSLLKQTQARKDNPKTTLFDRLGGVFGISAAVNDFSDRLLVDPMVGANSANPYLRTWVREKSATRLPGLKFMRTLWLADVASGGKYKFVPSRGDGTGSERLNLTVPHCPFKISPEEFKAVAKVLEETLKDAGVENDDVKSVLTAFAAHQQEVTTGFLAPSQCPIQGPSSDQDTRFPYNE